MLGCFATTVRGLEDLLVDELITLGATEINKVNAGVEFQADFNAVMLMNLHSRLASRIMLRLDFSGYRHEQDIYMLARRVKWDKWFNVGNTIKVSTNAIRCPLKSLDFVTLTVKDAICDYFVEKTTVRPDVDKLNPDVRIYVFLTEESVIIYLDTSGEALFKRGYRQSKLEAPLRENLAYGLLRLSNWQPTQALYDPMCGSGTIIAEAVSYALNIAPGLHRQFAFEYFVDFPKDVFLKQKEDAANAINYQQQLQIYANDINPRAVEIAKDNLTKAGLAAYVNFSCGDFIDLATAPATSGVLLTNPPYGLRLDTQQELAATYPAWGSTLKNKLANWCCYFFSGDLSLAKLIRLKSSRKIVLWNGALECRLFEFKMVSGSNRKITNNESL